MSSTQLLPGQVGINADGISIGMIEQFVLTMHGTGCIIVQMGNLLRAQVQRYPIVSIQV